MCLTTKQTFPQPTAGVVWCVQLNRTNHTEHPRNVSTNIPLWADCRHSTGRGCRTPPSCTAARYDRTLPDDGGRPPLGGNWTVLNFIYLFIHLITNGQNTHWQVKSSDKSLFPAEYSVAIQSTHIGTQNHADSG